MCPKAAIVEACSLVWILTGAGSMHCWPKLAKEHSLRTVHPNDHSVGNTAACAVFAYLFHPRKLCSLAATLAKALVICSKFWRKVYWRKARNTCMLSGKNTGSDKIFFTTIMQALGELKTSSCHYLTCFKRFYGRVRTARIWGTSVLGIQK